MPYGHVDPAKRVRQQQALRNLAQPNGVSQGSPVQPVQSPLSDLQVQNQIIYGNGNTTPRYVNPRQGALGGAIIGAAIAVLIAKNWHRGWVRGSVTALLTFFVIWVVTCSGACVVSAFVKPGDQSDLGPILGLTALASLLAAWFAAIAAVRSRPKESLQELQDSPGIGDVR